MKFLFSLLLTILLFISGLPFFKNYLSGQSLLIPDGKLEYNEFFYFLLFFMALHFLSSLSVHALSLRTPKVKDVSYKVFDDDEVRQVPVDVMEEDSNKLEASKSNMSEILQDVHDDDFDPGSNIEDKIRKK